jgi:predicted NBD/HSP70 family sugar kinase
MGKCYVGIDIGKTNMRFAVSGTEPELEYYSKRTYLRDSPDYLFRQIFKGIQEAVQVAGYQKKDIQGIGIGVPAVVNRQTGSIVWGPDWDFLSGVSITKPIADFFNVPVVADVDTVMAAWGEQWAGYGQTCDRFAMLTWGTGVGAAIIINGEVAENPDNLFAEFGHSTVSDDDWPCKCGSVGCVDTMVCGGGIARHGYLAVIQGQQTLLKNLCGNDPLKITSHMVFEAANKGDKVALSILERVAVLLGRLCANVVHTIQPKKIVIVGGLAERSRYVLESINRTMSSRCWLIFKGLTECEVVASKLTDTAGVLGAIYKVQKIVASRNED